MAGMEFRSIRGKSILFILVDGFERENFEQLYTCLHGKDADILIASFNGNDDLVSKDGIMRVISDIALHRIPGEYYDAIVIADDVTADAVRENPAVIKLIETAWGRGNPVVTVGKGASALIGAGVVLGRTIAASPDIYDELEAAGAKVAGTPIAVSGNILSAENGADMDVLCRDLVNYLVVGKPWAA